METDLAGADVPTDRAGLRDGGVQGLWVRGETPKELVLSDGTRLDLAPADGGRVEWWRRDEVDGHAEPISVAAAERLAGEDFTSYVEVRTRAKRSGCARWRNGARARPGTSRTSSSARERDGTSAGGVRPALSRRFA